MSGHVSLEYGFPSTHATNAVSVAIYTLLALRDPSLTIERHLKFALEAVSYFYALSIIVGRLYCGMHGFFDVLIGSVLGGVLSLIEHLYGPTFDAFIYAGTFKEIFILILIVLVLVRIHPEPADDCPCFDDSVSFAGVMIGVEFGNWHYASSGHAWPLPVPATVPFRFAHIGLPKTVVRIIIGVITIFAWREVAKPSLHRFLPPLFRIFEKLGISIPRKFFMQASSYENVPTTLLDVEPLPAVSEIPAFMTAIRHPRKRTVSIGPQSEADVHETIAYRDKRRRESASAQDPSNPRSKSPPNRVNGTSPVATLRARPSNTSPSPSRLQAYEQMMGSGTTPLGNEDGAALEKFPSFDINVYTETGELKAEVEAEVEAKEMFSRLAKPRVRYDVEVITKLIVYSGIAWLAVEGNPLLFEVLGLGMGKEV